MAKIFKPLELCRILEELGFARVRQRGSHVQYRNAIDGRQTTVPMHKGRDIAPGLALSRGASMRSIFCSGMFNPATSMARRLPYSSYFPSQTSSVLSVESGCGLAGP